MGPGKIAEHLKGSAQSVPQETVLGRRGNTRADLVALYFLPDPKMSSSG